jgi:hypothetical protein
MEEIKEKPIPEEVPVTNHTASFGRIEFKDDMACKGSMEF